MEYLKNATDEELDTFHNKIAKNVKEIREKKGRTQLDLALSIGFKSATFISTAENPKDKKHFNLNHLYQIAKELDVDVIDFFK